MSDQNPLPPNAQPDQQSSQVASNVSSPPTKPDIEKSASMDEQPASDANPLLDVKEPVKIEAQEANQAEPSTLPNVAANVNSRTASDPLLKTVGGDVDSESPAKALAVDEARLDAGDRAVLAESSKQTRRSFVLAAAAAAAGYGFYRWIDKSPGIEMQPEPFRKAFQANAQIARTVFRDHSLAPTYELKEAQELRVNGVYGLKKELVPESWRLQLVGSSGSASHPRYVADVTAWEYHYKDSSSHEDQGHDTKVDPNAMTSTKMAPALMLDQARANEERTTRMPRGKEEAGESHSTLKPQTSGLLLTIEDILKLPRRELVTQFKCIEGWSQIVHWAGVRMADFLEAYPPEPVDGKESKYVYMETPDGDYYTGYDLDVCRHPQTLLVTEMMGAPLTQFHGAPLRLHMPTKYGYKQIKRIGLISYTNEKPDDYWTKLGYDWYAGL